MNKARILIVEDEALVAKDLKSRLTDIGYHVCGQANSGLKAIELAQSKSPDLILMDIVLKGDMDGIEAAERIRTSFGIPVVFLTAYADQEKLDRAKLSLPFGYILKPFQARELEITLELAIYASKLAKERLEAEDMLKESEELHRITLSNISDAVFLTDDLGRFVFICPNVNVIFGYNYDEVIGFGDIFTLIGKRFFIREKLEIKGELRNIEIDVKDRNQEKHHLLVNIKQVAIKNGTTLIVCRDITERRKAEEELKLSRQQLIQSQKMEALGTLVAGVAHEINNPINLISFNINMLQSVWRDLQPVLETDAGKNPGKVYGGLPYSYLDKNLDQLVSDMDSAAKSITKIIVNLKNFVRGAYDLQKKPLNINDSVENALRLASTTIRKQHINIKTNLNPNLPLIEADQQAIEQVLLNLVINAGQAIDHDSGHIKIETSHDQKRGRVNVRVEDNGSGVNPDTADRIFNPFFTTKQTQGGTGLGLSVSYSLIKSHEGDIIYKNSSGQGSIFTVSIPTPERTNIKKILIVDDDPYIRDVLDRALSRNKRHIIEFAENGEEACFKLGMSKPDLIVLDLFMPLMDGVEVCRMIQSEPNLKNTKAFIITGNTLDAKVQEVKDLGFSNIFSKPLDIQSFTEHVNETLDES